jgi:hypothetical protein
MEMVVVWWRMILVYGSLCAVVAFDFNAIFGR